MLREFTDADGVGWVVWNVQPDRAGARARFVSPDLAHGWLCFQSVRGDRLRLKPTPPNWATWSETALRQALQHAQPVSATLPRGSPSPKEGRDA